MAHILWEFLELLSDQFVDSVNANRVRMEHALLGWHSVLTSGNMSGCQALRLLSQLSFSQWDSHRFPWSSSLTLHPLRAPWNCSLLPSDLAPPLSRAQSREMSGGKVAERPPAPAGAFLSLVLRAQLGKGTISEDLSQKYLLDTTARPCLDEVLIGRMGLTDPPKACSQIPNKSTLEKPFISFRVMFLFSVPI